MALLQGVRVLVVDDNHEHLEMLSLVLRQAGAQVQTATSAQEALETFQAGPPDVLLSDLLMLEASGFVLIRRVRSMPQGQAVPAIAVSGLPWETYRQKALEAGFSEWLSKPAADSVIAVVARLTGRGQ